MSSKVNEQATLKPGFVSRAATMADVETMVDLLNAHWEPLIGVRKVTVEEIRNIFTVPGFDIQTSTRVVLSPDGHMVGLMAVIDLASPPVHPSLHGCVHSDFEGRGIGTYLIQWGKERARQAISRVPDGARVSMHLTTSSAYEPTRRLFEKLGLNVIRYSWIMTIDLNGTPPEPNWPDGFTICTHQDYADGKAIYRAAHEAFQDHWGYVIRDEEEGLERWQHRLDNDEEFDPSLWFLALDGDEIAAVALCSPSMGGDQEMGWVDTLGVRRPWRRRGLALALLQHVFGEFHRRGKKRVGLGVDAESLTGATRLYEKAGMHTTQQLASYEQELRPGKELGTQSVED